MTDEMYQQLVELLGTPAMTLTGKTSRSSAYVNYGLWTPVTDRVLADCVYGNRKGCWDWLVANRIDANMSFIKAYLYQFGVTVHIKEMPFVYTREQYFMVEQYQRICTNYATLNRFLQVSTLQPVWHNAGEGLFYEDINILEKYIVETLDAILQLFPDQLMCGTASCGEA